ncbi:2OG-Fe(II) oxygenase family protein [Alteromonas sp. a30]|uniref:2OG-Fe(II) oxygenase family protein n=1 Tax=Alteromonas sp. a30 TaxID=2730917 RepID=UPI00227F8650|nr:2OG-Fe(II) oxygenase [Alteromonas sp. a30]MCY7297183.1 2OG-Fe(II) oxygenase [Alteromonas sp. a30]
MAEFIKIIDNVLSPELCKKLMRKFEKSKNVQPGRTGGGVDTDKKISSDVSIITNQEFQPETQEVLQQTTHHIVEYFREHYFALIGPLGLTLVNPETGKPEKVTQDNFAKLAEPQLPMLVQNIFRLGDVTQQMYKQGRGGYPYWHSETYPQLQHNDALHRMLLFMFYLNDVEEGGETEFYYQKMKVKPKQGTMVIAPAYFTHTHRGNIPKSGDKYILTSWVLFNPAEKLYGQPPQS